LQAAVGIADEAGAADGGSVDVSSESGDGETGENLVEERRVASGLSDDEGVEEAVLDDVRC